MLTVHSSLYVHEMLEVDMCHFFLASCRDMPLRGEVDEFVRSFEATVMGQSDMDEGKMLNILEGFIGSWMLPAGSDSEVADLEMPGSSAQLASIAK